MSFVHSAASVTIFAIIYRPDSQPLSVKFFDELMSLFEIILLYKSCLVIAGDLNIHVNDPDDCHGKHFCELLELLGLSQHVFQSTHVRGHTLNLIITREDSRVHDICVDSPVYFDHCLITCKLPSILKPIREISLMFIRN